MQQTDSPRGRERRRAPRAAVSFPVELHYRDETRRAHLRDVSSIGLCCTFPEAIDELTQVRFSLRLPGDSRRHDIVGAVVRCEKLRGKSPPTYEIAIFFADVEPESRQAIEQFVEAEIAGLETGAGE